jgi:hypothetical protein
MILRLINVSLACFSLLSACQPTATDGSSGSSGRTARVDGQVSNADLVRNPVSGDGSIDTNQLARISFDETSHDFGPVDEGAQLSHRFTFTNTGNIPLLISDARSTCGCTVPDWPRSPIPPGGKGEILVKFDTQNKPGKQQKPVTITANTFPAQTQVFIRAEVDPAPGK